MSSPVAGPPPVFDASEWDRADGMDVVDRQPMLMPSAADLVGCSFGFLQHELDQVLSDLDSGASSLASGQVVTLLRQVESIRRRLPAIEHRLLAQVATRRIHDDYCQPSPATLIATELNLTGADAAARASAAAVLGPRVALDGRPLTPELDLVAEAQEIGQLSERHATVITRAMRLLPPAVDPALRQSVESELVGHAGAMNPTDLARVAQRVLDHLDPDGREPAAERAERLRGATFYRRADGTYRLRGELTADCGIAWQTVLDTLARPLPEADGLPDDRSPAQRRHDALRTAADLLLAGDDLPRTGGLPATIIVTVDAQDLAERRGFATTAHGDLWPMVDMLAALEDRARWVTVFRSDTDGVLAYGTDRRFASDGQTFALIARDGGCTFPRCDVPAAWCQRHHIDPVVPRDPGQAPGPTDVDNLTLLCGYHHRTFDAAGWRCQMINGRPHWIPPARIDPEQRPLLNTHWQKPEPSVA